MATFDAVDSHGARADVAAVVIGRNEGARLIRCIDSLRAQVAMIVYVDSGSVDGSVEAVRAAGATVVLLDESAPFSAARGRNAGAAAVAAADPGGALRYLQFVDGDCEVENGWVAAAAAFLDANPGAAVACGLRRERFPAATPYNRLCDMEWNTPVGRARSCGGDALIRRDAFERAGGFDPAMIAGEEPELCVRLRAAGGDIWRLDRAMTIHDAAITRFGQWWRRALRSGWAYAEGAARHGRRPERHNMAALRSILIWGAALPAAVATLAFGAAGAAVLGGAWPASAIAALGGGALWLLMALRIAAKRRARFGDPWPHAALYAAFVMIGKIAQALGVLRRLRDRRRGGTDRIIEYKSAS